MRVKRATVDGKVMGQYFHARWWQWSILIIKIAEDLIIGIEFRIDSGWADKFQGNVTLFNKFAPF